MLCWSDRKFVCPRYFRYPTAGTMPDNNNKERPSDWYRSPKPRPSRQKVSRQPTEPPGRPASPEATKKRSKPLRAKYQPEDDDDDDMNEMVDMDDFTGAAAASARAFDAEEEQEDDEEVFLTSGFAAVVPDPARFCSADACSVRKDVTRRARRRLQLSPPGESTPAGAEPGQQVGKHSPPARRGRAFLVGCLGCQIPRQGWRGCS